MGMAARMSPDRTAEQALCCVLQERKALYQEGMVEAAGVELEAFSGREYPERSEGE